MTMNSKQTEKLGQKRIDVLVAAILAVNSYPVEKVVALLPNLRKAGLTSPSEVARMDYNELIPKLVKAGYDRGQLVSIISPRLKALMVAIEADTLSGLERALAEHDSRLVQDLLCQIPGIGPVVAKVALKLMQDEPSRLETSEA